MSVRKRICVVGSANVDLTFRTPQLPLPGQTVTGRSLMQGMGGKGANQAVAASRLGVDVAFVARIGCDGFGQQAVDAYKQENIDVSFVHRSADSPTGTAAILVDDHGENCIAVIPGANAELTPDDVMQAAPWIQQADAVLCQLETPVASALQAFRLARDAGALTVLTPAPAEHVTTELLSLCDVCIPNQTEISTIAGRVIQTQDDAIGAARVLLDHGVKTVAITMGSDGVILVQETQSLHVPAVKVDAVDTTGAGDSFTAAFAVALVTGHSMANAAHWAAMVAARSVTRQGTQTSFPRLDELTR